MSADDAHAEAERRFHPNRVGTIAAKDLQAGFVQGAEWQSSRPFTDEEVEVAELREWVDGKRSWSDQHHGLPNEIELTARADEATIRLLIAKLDARAALAAVTARHNPETGGSES